MPSNPVEFILMFSTGFVAFVLLLSGAAKIGRTSRTLDSMAGIGVPAVLQRRWVAAMVPVWEIALGVALLVLPALLRVGAAVLVFGTFAVFTVLIVDVLRRGASVDCGCFGALSVDDRVTWWTAARNAILMLAALMIALTAPGHPSFMLQLATSSKLLLLAVALGWALLAVAMLVRANIRLRDRRIETPAAEGSGVMVAAKAGMPIPDAELVSPEGVTVPLHALGHGSPVLLIFLSAECGKCASTARRLPQWQQLIAPVLLRVATSSRPDVLKERVPEVLPFAYFGARSAKRALGVEGIPSAVLLGGLEYRFIASPIAHREDEIDALVRGIVEARSRA